MYRYNTIKYNTTQYNIIIIIILIIIIIIIIIIVQNSDIWVLMAYLSQEESHR